MIKASIYKPVKVTENLYKLGTPAFPMYLSLGENAMIIEGGIGIIYPLVVDQINELGISPQRIKYIALTHTHADHIGTIPHLQTLWPHLKIIAGRQAAKLLKDDGVLTAAQQMDHVMNTITLRKGLITEPVPDIEKFDFNSEIIVGENDRIELGKGIVWRVCETPGHSVCHISYHEEKEGITAIGDATGFYVPEKDIFWPNYFDSLERYCNSIHKLAALPSRKGILSHNHIINRDVKHYLQKALRATEILHHELLDRVSKGEDKDIIALEKAKWVSTLTDDHPFEIMVSLSKLLTKRSVMEAENNISFKL